MQPLGKVLVLVGVLIVVIGLVVWLAGDKLNWFGNLPGDIRITNKNMRFYAPITSMLLISILLISILLSALLWVFRKFF